MIVWFFRGSDRLNALTVDQAGINLPIDLGPWELVRAITLSGGHPDEDEALALIAEYGFCCFPETGKEQL